MGAARFIEPCEEANEPLQQVLHLVVECRTAAQLGFQRSDVVGGQIGGSIARSWVLRRFVCWSIDTWRTVNGRIPR